MMCREEGLRCYYEENPTPKSTPEKKPDKANKKPDRKPNKKVNLVGVEFAGVEEEVDDMEEEVASPKPSW